jgi:hypothetical protein
MIVLAVLLSTDATTVYAEGHTYIGEGTISCGAWTERRAENEGSEPRAIAEAWVLGFISGANIYPAHPEMLSNPDADAIWAWIDNYCRSNPLDRLVKANFALVDELLRRADAEKSQ